ncbi:hypothetical protein V2E67_002559 [Citrobacter freundii]|nr:hypothetical protein [Citrobacter freundii]
MFVNLLAVLAIVFDATVNQKLYTALLAEGRLWLYDLSALTKIAPMFQFEDCCYVVLEKDGEEVRRLLCVDPTTLLPGVNQAGLSTTGLSPLPRFFLTQPTRS